MLVRVTLAALATAGNVAAQEIDRDEGRALYLTYCVQCHGLDATGNGPMAELVAIQTPDLTRLAARNDGVFPTEAVARQIDGRARLLAHGGNMPIYGPILEGGGTIALRLPGGQVMMVGRPLADIIAYLQSVQTE